MRIQDRWRHVAMLAVLLGGVNLLTKADSCNGEPPPSTVVATADPSLVTAEMLKDPALVEQNKAILAQMPGVVVVVTLVDKLGQPVAGRKATLFWNSDTSSIAGVDSSGISDDKGGIVFQGFPDADYGTWNLSVEGTYTQTVPRFRRSGNPNLYTHVLDLIPSPSPSETPTPEPTPTPTLAPTPTPVPAPTFFYSGGGGGTTSTPTATPVPGSGPASTTVIVTDGSPQAAFPNATFAP